MLASLTTTGELKVWDIGPVLEALESSTGHQNIDNADELLLGTVELKMRASCLAVYR